MSFKKDYNFKEVKKDLIELQSTASSLDEFIKSFPTLLDIILLNEYACPDEIDEKHSLFFLAYDYAKLFKWPKGLNTDPLAQMNFMASIIALNVFKKWRIVKDFHLKEDGISVVDMIEIRPKDLRDKLYALRQTDVFKEARTHFNNMYQSARDIHSDDEPTLDEHDFPWFTPKAEEKLIEEYTWFLNNDPKEDTDE